MASINGIEIKRVTHFVGHEGNCSQGNVYFKGRKVGFWSQDSWGGPDSYNFNTKVFDKALKNYQDAFPDSYVYKNYLDDPDLLMYELDYLCELEKLGKQSFKKGAKAVIIVSDRYHISTTRISKEYSKEELLKKFKGLIEEEKKRVLAMKPHRENCHVFCATSLDDFHLSLDKDHPAPDFMVAG